MTEDRMVSKQLNVDSLESVVGGAQEPAELKLPDNPVFKVASMEEILIAIRNREHDTHYDMFGDIEVRINPRRTGALQ